MKRCPAATSDTVPQSPVGEELRCPRPPGSPAAGAVLRGQRVGPNAVDGLHTNSTHEFATRLALRRCISQLLDVEIVAATREVASIPRRKRRVPLEERHMAPDPKLPKKSRHPGQQVRGSRTNCYATQCRGLPWNCPPLPRPCSCHNNSNLTVSGDMANWVLFNTQHGLFPGGRRRLTTSNPSSSKMIAEVLSRFNTCLTSSCHHNM